MSTSKKLPFEFTIEERIHIIKLLYFPKNAETKKFEKYLYLEKLLLAAQEEKKNSGYFTTNDAIVLTKSFDLDKNDLYERYCNIDNHCTPTSLYRPDRQNFDAMFRISSNRNPNKLLIAALIESILTVSFYLDESDCYHIKPANWNHNTLTENEYHEIIRYINFCLVLTKIKKEKYLKPYLLEDGNFILEEKSLSNIESIIKKFNKIECLLADYICPSSLIEAKEAWEEDRCARENNPEYYFLEEEFEAEEFYNGNIEINVFRKCNLFEKFPLFMTQCFRNAPTNLLYFLYNNLSMLEKLDQNFWQLLFLLQFFNDAILNSLLEYQPQLKIIVNTKHSNSYHKCVKQIIEIPDIFFLDQLPTFINEDDIVKKIFLSIEEPHHLPIWSYYTMLEMSQQNLTTAKYLYLTFILGYRYKNDKINKKLPQELLNILIEQNNINVNKYIEKSIV